MTPCPCPRTAAGKLATPDSRHACSLRGRSGPSGKHVTPRSAVPSDALAELTAALGLPDNAPARTVLEEAARRLRAPQPARSRKESAQ